MASLPDFTIGDSWVSLNVLSGIAVGTSMKIQNKSNTWAYLVEANAAPVNPNLTGELITDLSHMEPSKIIAAGSGEIWAKTSIEGRAVTLNIQQI